MRNVNLMMPSPQYDKTIVKLRQLIIDLEKSISLNEADEKLEILRRYDKCHYCVKYRKTLDEKGWAGCCDGCPCHKLGEYILGRRRSYNGCYVIEPYKAMVKAAFVFHDDKCREYLNVVILDIYRVIAYMNKNKDIL